MQYPKRLIEVDLPIKRISEHARREKSIRHGHISTLHIWWARRPLAACRAVLCASLWPDPADPLCPALFKDTAQTEMLNWAKNHQNKMSGESLRRFLKVSEDHCLLKEPVTLRKALLDFIADFANWDNSTDADYLRVSRYLTQVAHESLGGIPGSRPLVADPFAGGGAIPLEALRVGAEAFASDLNPVAVLLNKVMLEYIPKYGNTTIEMEDEHGQPIAFNGLAEAVEYWGNWIKNEAEKDLAEFYPKDEDGSTPIAYLWARTVISEAPDDGSGIPIEIPLLRSLWLCKKPKKKVALRWVRDVQGQIQTETLDVTYANGQTLTVRRPLLEIFEPKNSSDVVNGTVNKGSVTCPITDFVTPVKSVRKQLKSRSGGADDARMVSVIITKPNDSGKFYRMPKQHDLRAFERTVQKLRLILAETQNGLSVLPDEKLENIKGRFNIHIYGMESWRDVFNPRQSLSMIILSKCLKKIKNNNHVIRLLLSFLIDKQADSLTSLVSWASSGEFQRNTFGRQSLPMVWDYVEINPLCDSSGNFNSGINWVSLFIKKESQSLTANNFGTIIQASASEHPLPNDSVQTFFTDPPYYDAIPYSDLSDFFYVWLKRNIGEVHKELFKSSVAPKNEEIVYISHLCSKYSKRTSEWFEDKMSASMSEGRRLLAPDGIGIVVFAHKTTKGWEAQLQAMINAGWIITSSWPIDTERASRNIAIDSAALGSSIHLVCRPRENPDGSLITDYIGDWRDVLQELPERIHAWLPRLAEEGVVGADAIFACLGPALEVFSRYASVEKPNGEEVTLREYLEHVWAAVAKEALNMIFQGADTSGFEEDARLTAMWLWTVNTAANLVKENTVSENKLKPSFYPGANFFPGVNAYVGPANKHDEASSPPEVKIKSTGYTLEYDAARKIAQGLGAHLEQLPHLIEVKGAEAKLMAVADRTEYLLGIKGKEAQIAKTKKKASKQLSMFDAVEELAQEGASLSGSFSPGKTVLDQVHQAMILFAAGKGDTLKNFLVGEGVGRNERFWRLAQALSALYPIGTDEKRWVDGVLVRKKGLGF